MKTRINISFALFLGFFGFISCEPFDPSSSIEPALFLIKVAGDSQKQEVNKELFNELKVLVKNQQDQVIEGIVVEFSPESNEHGFLLDSNKIQTDSNGFASTKWVLGTLVGTQKISVQIFTPETSTNIRNTIEFSATAITNCPDSILDQRDGKTYKTTRIGDQCWMAENLNVGERVDGIIQLDWKDNAIQKHCYENLDLNCDLWGGLYSWPEAMHKEPFLSLDANDTMTIKGHQGICPHGWSIPTDEEWKILESILGVTEEELCTTSVSSVDIFRGEANNSGEKLKIGSPIGFDALLGGCYGCFKDSTFSRLNDYGYFLSSEYLNHKDANDETFIRGIRKGRKGIIRRSLRIRDSFSVRCIKSI